MYHGGGEPLKKAYGAVIMSIEAPEKIWHLSDTDRSAPMDSEQQLVLFKTHPWQREGLFEIDVLDMPTAPQKLLTISLFIFREIAFRLQPDQVAFLTRDFVVKQAANFPPYVIGKIVVQAQAAALGMQPVFQVLHETRTADDPAPVILWHILFLQAGQALGDGDVVILTQECLSPVGSKAAVNSSKSSLCIWEKPCFLSDKS